MTGENEHATNDCEPEDASASAEASEAADRSEKTATPKPKTQTGGRQNDASFPIVGIGASAGGLEAMEQFLTHMPSDRGMAFVLIVHLSPDYKSMLSNILQKYTAMPVVEIEDGMQVEPNSVYVIAPDADVGILNKTLQLLEPNMPRGRRAPIDYFFRSLANDQADQAIAIILSGTGSNGSLGIKAIKGGGGLVMVQTPETAKYDGMPRNAIATDLADHILPPAEMPGTLIEYVATLELKLTSTPIAPNPQNQAALQKVFLLLRNQARHDFSQYKQITIERRLSRRMAVHQFETLSEYVQYLSQNPVEVNRLFKELLIGVTRFFRDPEAFEALKEKVLPHLLADKPSNQPLRVWVAGCSTGEEAYSIAIVIKEYLIDRNLSQKVQVFASDIDGNGIENARLGIYPDGISVDVSNERMTRFFTPENSHYRISRDIRDMVVFAEQSVIKDAPFSRLDLISCRNLLIYLQTELQQKTLNLFHYSLRQDGILFLGTSETRVEGSDEQFVVFDRHWKFFRRVGKDTVHHDLPGFASDGIKPFNLSPSVVRPIPRLSTQSLTSPRNQAEEVLLTDYAPVAVIVDKQGDIFYIHGQTNLYLHSPSGEPPFNIMDMARESLHLQLLTGIHEAVQQEKTVVYDQLRIAVEGKTYDIKLTIKPLFDKQKEKDRLIVVFEELATSPEDNPMPAEQQTPTTPADKAHIVELEQQLVATKAYLQTTVEELETANEDVRAANEELQATNEELQSLNEELQTSQEELHSSNEELMTMNTDFQKQIDKLRLENDDIQNLLINSQIAMLFLDMELRIKHFTPPVTEVIRLIPSDVGRPLEDLSVKLDYNNLDEDAKQVLKTLNSTEVETQSHDGRWYGVRLQPYRTVKNVIDGVVITFIEITVLKELENRQLHMLDYLRSILATVREPLLVLTSELRVISANQAFYNTFAVDPEETETQLIYELGNSQWDIPELRHLLEQIIPRDNNFENFKVEHNFPSIGRRVMRLNARRLQQKEDEPELILLAFENVTEAE